jgi:sigma-B regulation protein RsbU (phosphoserine phosphatase)
MADQTRAWTPDEVDLVEAVAEQTRTALATAHVTQREHAIATQLQAALQPAPPGAVPGLALAEHYLPALDEAEIGGDFYDVFSTDKGVTYLAVGDLSGKGLAAAAQVATVRNMLRFALYQASYNGHSVARPLMSLNRTLADHGLLTGFATLFVGRYDGASGTLTYANAGQEPGLLWRAATGHIEELAATGPVLGMAESGDFDERTVTLTHGDVLAVFTDGLTEAGPNRRELLGVAGVAALLQGIAGARPADQPAPEAARATVTRLIADVDTYAHGGVRDDVCLLVGVVENSRGVQEGVSGNVGPGRADRNEGRV